MLQPSHDSFRALLDRAAAGSNEAAETLLQHYGPHVLQVVRRKLSATMREQFDSMDFTQAVWGSFFASKDRLAEFESPDALVAHLVTMARNKVVDQFRRQVLAKKRRPGPRVHVRLDSAEGHLAGGVLRQTTPSQVAIAKEQLDKLLAGLPAGHRRVVELKLAGHTQREIAEQLGMGERTVRRVLAHLQQLTDAVES